MKIDPEVLGVLSRVNIAEDRVEIEERLDRSLYVRTDKVLQACGGRWSRARRCHQFPDADPADLIAKVLATGEVTTHADLGFFPTPDPLARRMIEAADLREGYVVLEPSCGDGAIAKRVAQSAVRVAEIDCYELDPKRADAAAKALRAVESKHGPLWKVETADFLSVKPPATNADRHYDVVLMNPPFADGQDVAHVRHAFAFLRPGGRLVAVMSAGVSFRTDRKRTDFRTFVEAHGGRIEPLPPDSFKSSGTAVNTVLVAMKRGR